MPNLPGPYSVEYRYQALTREHVLELNTIAVGNPPPGTAVASVTLATKSGGSVPLQTGVQNFWNFYRVGHAAATSLLEWVLWKWTFDGLSKDFVCSGTVTNPLGAGGTAQPARQTVASMRTAGGSHFFINWIEGISNNDTVFALVPSGAGAYYQQCAAYLLSSEGWVIGRDDSFPVAGLRVSNGQNEAVWRKINRPNA